MLSLALLFTPSTPRFELTIESIMRGPALVGMAPRGLRWSEDGSELRFQWAKPDGKEEPSYREYVVKRDGTGLAAGSGNGRPGRAVNRGDQLGDQTVYESGGDIYLRKGSGDPLRLTNTLDREESPKLVANGEAVIYTKGDNLFRVNLTDGATTQLTNLKTEAPASSGSNPFGSGDSTAVAITIPTGYRNSRLAISPTGSHASIDLFQSPEGTTRAPVPNYITRSGYSELIPTYERVGTPQGTSKTLIYDLATGKMTELAPQRTGRLGQVRWSPDGKYAITWAYAEDHKDAWILGFEAASNKVAVLWTEHDDAWVGGPGAGTLGWLPDSSRFYFESENSGYAHLMTSTPQGESKALTAGKFEVSDVLLDSPRNRFVFVSSEGSPFKRHIDAIAYDGTGKEKLADYSADEDAAFALAPNGKDIAVVRSKANRPAELYVNNIQVTNTPTEEWLAGPWIDPPIVMIPARDGTPVPARFYKPKNWKRGGPAVIFAHGAGYLQNVYDGWSHYFREYMFHHLLADHGYAVLDIDYRGSAGYGKAWRTAIYRHMGGVDLTDQVDGAKWLVATQGVSKDRIGIYGGSYGGFLTLMAMFKEGDVFTAGAALRPVGDWASYHHGYTSPILNNPQDDKEAYAQSSPINFVEGLKGSLLICHGMVDTNVHFQDSVRIVQKLIDLGKKNWEVAPYPVENHAFTRPSSWIDEYRRILDLFDRTIGPGSKKK